MLSMKKLRLIFGTTLLTIVGLLSSRAHAQDQWLTLGEARITTTGTSTYVPSDTGKGTFCSIRFKTEGGTASVDQITVHFGNSQSMHIPTPNFQVSNDGYSPSIALPGVRRTIRGIDVVYKLGGTKASISTLNLWGNTLANFLVCPK